jgi:transcriptional regulator with XRE-family HTH domain
MIADVRMMTIAEVFGDVIEGALKRRELTLQQVAARARLSVGHIRELIRGQTEPKLGPMIRLAMAIGVSPIWLLEEVLTCAELHHDFSLPASIDARNARLRSVGAALTVALIGCSDRELSQSAVVGDRLLVELAKYALTVVALPGRGYELGSSIQ